jgi:hypothetical protein
MDCNVTFEAVGGIHAHLVFSFGFLFTISHTITFSISKRPIPVLGTPTDGWDTAAIIISIA